MTSPKPQRSDDEAILDMASVECLPWGRTHNGQTVQLFRLANKRLRIDITTFGARIVGILAPDRRGHQDDVVLGYKNLAGYEADDKTYMGATIGRYANRIAGGHFSLDGEVHQVPHNDGPNALHGGPAGFDRRIWGARIVEGGVEMTLRSNDGDMGFPGTLDVQVRFTLRDDALALQYTAVTDKPTIVNLTNHAYFNLDGEGAGTTLDHLVRVAADQYTPVGGDLIPTGEVAPVEHTPLDLRRAKRISQLISSPHPQLQMARGCDHNFALNAGTGSGMHLAAEISSSRSGRVLRVDTTEPGVQFYSGNFLNGNFTGKRGTPYFEHAGFCLETQHFPDSPHHPGFPSTVLQPGKTFQSTTTYSFGLAL